MKTALVVCALMGALFCPGVADGQTNSQCLITGPASVCPFSFNSYTAQTSFTNEWHFYRWSFATNSSGAVFFGTTNGTSVGVGAGGSGSFTLRFQVIEFIEGAFVVDECTYSVTSQDAEPPNIACGGTVVVDEDPESGGAIVIYDYPEVSDNCSSEPSVDCSPPSGSFFPVGTTNVTCTAYDSSENSASCTFQVQVVPSITPPVTQIPITRTNVPLGGSVTLCVEVTGTGPFEYQWRRNGANIPGETNDCIAMESISLNHGGSYTLAVANEAGAVLSDPILVLLDFPRRTGGDNFANRTTILGPFGVLAGSNEEATAENGEPRHAGKPGGSSIWYTWTPRASGIAGIITIGSTFDTLLAVYTGSNPSNLVEIVSDDERGGFHTSLLRFNAREGTNYQIVVDGYGGAQGEFLVGWFFEQTTVLLPIILSQPRSMTIAPGGRAEFTVDAVPGCDDGHHDCRHLRDHHSQHGNEDKIRVDYQWFRNGQAISGATNTNYVVLNARIEDVGDYTVQVSKFGRITESVVASLQLNLTGNESQNVRGENKFLDSSGGTPLELGGFGVPPREPPGLFIAASATASAGTIVHGYTGTQVFDTINGDTEPNDQLICGVIGGASVWVTFVPQDPGMLHLNTEGSTYNTVMAVFRRSQNNPNVLRQIDCDNNGGAGTASLLNVPVEAGQTNFVMVDGVQGAKGILSLNYSLVTTALVIALGEPVAGQPQVRVSGHPAIHFTIERSQDMITWTPVTTATAPSGIFDFVDTTAPAGPKYYRALILP